MVTSDDFLCEYYYRMGYQWLGNGGKGPSINYVRNFTCYLDPLPPFLHVRRNRNV